jgi:hypothetical protein
MPLPNLLIIGAMKAGTTSLYMDLAGHPQGFLAQDKEPHLLASDDILTEAGLARYAALYARSRDGQLVIDASTSGAKRPDVEGVAERACRVLPAGFRVVYVVRHPVERIISQHHHEHLKGFVGPSIDEEVRRHPRYVQYSRYSYQLEPWLEHVGLDRIRVIRFEDYVDSRGAVLQELFRFLGMDARGYTVDERQVYNKSEGKPVKRGVWATIAGNPAYRKAIRPLLPVKLRLRLQQAMLPKGPDRLAPPSAATRAWLHDAVADDVARLAALLGRSAPMWDDFPAGGAPTGAANQSAAPARP